MKNTAKIVALDDLPALIGTETGVSAWLTVTQEDSTMYVNYGFNNIRFINPVRVGKRIRARSTLLSVTEKKPGQFLICTQVKVEVEEEKNPALVAEWLNLAFV